MKKIYTMLFLIFIGASYGQTPEDVQRIVSNYDVEAIENHRDSLKVINAGKRKKAMQMAPVKGWPLKIENRDGSVSKLVSVDDNGKPVYITMTNTESAIASRTNYLHSGGGLNLDLEGQDMVAYVWDGGAVLATHDELNTRITYGDVPDATDPVGNSHATHVTGTMIASGQGEIAAKGMAPQATGITYDATDDDAEAADATLEGMLVSNHSYEYGGIFADDEDFGRYGTHANVWDNIMYDAPYYLMVTGAGNRGTDNNNGNPIAAGYDKLLGFQTAKNNLVVGNADEPVLGPNGEFISAVMYATSNQGPTDDMRIKPDITARGVDIYSCIADNNSAYEIKNGTSMASPGVSGSLLLLQQYNKELYGEYMRAATLKGLAMHTADDMTGTGLLTGPDAVSGWGMFNARRAAEAIRDNGSHSMIYEGELEDDETAYFYVKSNGIDPLQVSLSWTDKAYPAVTGGTANLNADRLINDLDVSVYKGVYYDPWRLVSATSNSQSGLNLRDTFERVDITSPTTTGTYQIKISHGGNLNYTPQKYSLIVTGITFCSTNTANITIVDPLIAGDMIHEHTTATVTASNTIAAAGEAHYRAGNYVFLADGFFVENSGVFLADTGVCGSLFDPGFEGNGFRRPMDQDIATRTDAGMMLKVYPNPADTSVTVALEEGTMARIILSSMDGKPVFDREASGISQKIDISSLQAGLYIVTVESASGKKYNEKLIVN